MYAEGLLPKAKKKVAGLDMEGAIVQHTICASGRAIADSEKRGLHRLCVSGQRGQVFHDEQFVVEQFHSQGVGAHVLQRHAVGFVAANSRRSRRVVHHIVVLGVSTSANVQSFWGVCFLFSEQIGKKTLKLFYSIATKMAIFNTHIKIETCAEEGSPVDKKNSTWRENWHTTYFYRIFVA